MKDQRRDASATTLGFLPWLISWLILVACLALFYSCSTARADDIYFPLGNLTTGAVTNRKVLITPLELYPGTNQMAVYDRTMLTSTTNGTLTISNMVQGLYRADIQAPPQLTSFYFFVPTNGTGGTQIYVNTILRATPQQVARPQDYAYSASASDARYATAAAVAAIPIGVTNGQSGVILPNPTTTNLASYGGTVTINTNGGDSVLFKNANGTSLLTWDDAAQQFHFNTNFPISGNGSTLQFLEAGNITSGTVAPQRLPQNQTNDLNTGLSSKIGNATNDLNTVTAARDMAKTNGTGYTNTLNNPTLNNANIVSQPLWVMYAFDNGFPYKLWMLYSVDGINFDFVGPDPIFIAKAGSQITRDPRVFVTSTNIYMALTGPTSSGGTIWVLSSTNYVTWQSNQVFSARATSGISTTWGPKYFVTPDNILHMITEQSTNGVVGYQPYDQVLTNGADISSWGPAVEMGGWRQNVWSNDFDHAFAYTNSIYYSFFKQEDAVGLNTNAYIGLATNASGDFRNNWYLLRSNNWAGFGVGMEAQSLLQMPNGDWSIFYEEYAGGAFWRSDCTKANFPFTWGTRQRVRTPFGISNPAILCITNAAEMVRIFGAVAQLKRGGNSMFTLSHAPYIDNIFGANIFNSGTNNSAAGWQYVDSIDTNQTAIFLNFYTGTGNPEIDFWWFPKNGLAGGVRNSFGVINSSGWNGGVVGTTVSASSTMTASSTLIATIGEKILTMSAAPTPAQIGANNGWLWVSNTILYYSYTANGSTSNNAVKIAP